MIHPIPASGREAIVCTFEADGIARRVEIRYEEKCIFELQRNDTTCHGF